MSVDQEVLSLREDPQVKEVQGGDGLPATAGTMTVDSHESCELANSFLVEAKTRIKTIDEKLDPRREMAYRAYQGWISLIKELKEPYQKVVNYLSPRIANYLAEVERKRREEEEHLRLMALEEEKKRREAEEKAKLEEAAALEAAGDKELAEQMLAEAEQVKETPITVTVAAPATPKVEIKGSAMRENWVFEIYNKSLIPREYLITDESKIGKVVKALKNKTRIPGVRVYNQPIMVGSRKGMNN